MADEAGGAVATISASVSPDAWGRIQDLLANFWSDPSMTPAAGAEQLAEIVALEG